MKCPIDDSILQMTDRQGIEIDYCPQCRGVWLDRGELDKLIDRSAGEAALPPQQAPPPQQTPPQSSSSYEHRSSPSYPSQQYGDRRRDSGSYKKKKKESFLGDLFDF